MPRPWLLDLCCGAGGVAEGYARAGFNVVGVDIVDQPHYPFDFIRDDALTVSLAGFAAIHASPPCQAYSPLAALHPDRAASYPRLIEPIRERLQEAGVPYVIENVPGAPLIDPVLLCGSMFGLCVERGWLCRHRLFECSFPVLQPECEHPEGVRAIGVYGGNGVKGKHNRGFAQERRDLMGIDWMNRAELAEAIPPAYTHHIGHYLREHV